MRRGCSAGRASSARSSPASAPTCCSSTVLPSTSPTASATTRSRPCSWRASSSGCVRTRRGGWRDHERSPRGEIAHPARRGRAMTAIAAADLRDRLAGLAPIGLAEDGTTRLAWTRELAAAEDWFRDQARGAGRRVERDPAGSLWAVPDAPGPWWATGSHLDSVCSGGRFDGALGVAAGFAVAERLPGVAVIAFADEEGARFNTPTFGSRALVGRLDVAEVLTRADEDGVTLAAALAGAGVGPEGLAGAPSWLARLRGFLEVHIDQSRELAEAGAPAGVVAALAGRLRLAVT